MNRPSFAPSLEALQDAIIASVLRDGPDLTTRQLGVLLIGYLDTEPQTVRGLAQKLNVSKPAISRILDRLTDLKLAARKADPADRRSVLMAKTADGERYLTVIGHAMSNAAKKMDPGFGTGGSRYSKPKKQ